MKTAIQQTTTYILTDLDRLDPVTVYVSNYGQGRGKIVIECYGEAWASYWGGMGDRTIQEFILESDNVYLLNKFLKNTTETDFDEINEVAQKRGFDLCVTSDVEIAMSAQQMTECFGNDWMLDLPTRETPEYHYLGRILNTVKAACAGEIYSSQEAG